MNAHTPGPWELKQEAIDPEWHIAAAPDLLEALRGLMAAYDNYPTQLPDLPRWKAARSAIAKAEGRAK